MAIPAEPNEPRRPVSRSLVPSITLALVLSAGPASPATACPNCKEAVAAQPSEVAGMARGYNYSVLFMVSMPFALLGTGAFFVARAAKRGAFPEF
jgi:hypothetical protein